MTEFKYKPKIFYRGTKKYIFYQYHDDSTLIIPLRPTAKSNTVMPTNLI
tara:strand:+ start:122 stop:268 length:147 start_codon:yes stop_codon:yes gene_type:complete